MARRFKDVALVSLAALCSPTGRAAFTWACKLVTTPTRGLVIGFRLADRRRSLFSELAPVVRQHGHRVRQISREGQVVRRPFLSQASRDDLRPERAASFSRGTCAGATISLRILHDGHLGGGAVDLGFLFIQSSRAHHVNPGPSVEFLRPRRFHGGEASDFLIRPQGAAQAGEQPRAPLRSTATLIARPHYYDPGQRKTHHGQRSHQLLPKSP